MEGVHDATLDLGMVVADADSQALEAGELRLEALEGVERKTGAGLSIEEKPRVGPEQSVIHMPSCYSPIDEVETLQILKISKVKVSQTVGGRGESEVCLE